MARARGRPKMATTMTTVPRHPLRHRLSGSLDDAALPAGAGGAVPGLELTALSKRFGDVRALDG